MRVAISRALVSMWWFLRIFGAIALLWLLIFGVYSLFARSVSFGSMLIGGAVVGGWVLQAASALLFAGALRVMFGMKDSEDNA
jgi:hypothetical protein